MLNRVDLNVIGAEGVDYVVVLARFAYPSVSALQFALLKLSRWAVKSDKEHIKWLKELHEARHPRLGLNDVFDDEVIAGLGQCRQATMESFEERGSHARPGKIPIFDALHGQDASIAKVVYRVMPERLIEACLKSPAERGLPRARRTVNEDDLSSHGAIRMRAVLALCEMCWVSCRRRWRAMA
jgi:hypothetical protein